VDGKVGAEQLAPLPEAVEGSDDGAGEESLQDLLHKGDLCLGNGGLVAQVSHLPCPVGKQNNIGLVITENRTCWLLNCLGLRFV
jgi:hypothetical protein